MIKYAFTQDVKDCCGCQSCEQICGQRAIAMKANEEGFLYPALDKSACVDCGLCESVCPMTKSADVLHSKGVAYAAQNKDAEALMSSSSGGMFVAIANEVIKQGGVVYGAAFAEGHKVEHIRVENAVDLARIKGSKYVQSAMHNIFVSVKKDLNDDRMVYFTGTPCQVAALKLFLHKDYPKLITSDLICHGVPSLKLLQLTIQRMEQRLGATFSSYSFRDKTIRGWSCSSSSSYIKNNSKQKIEIKYSQEMEAYFNAFLSGSLMRISCYSCPLARIERAGDMTLADLWGVRKIAPQFPNIVKGVSLLIINSERGAQMLDAISNNLQIMPISIDVAAANNTNLRHPTPWNEARAMSYKLAFNDYNRFVRTFYRGNYLWNKTKIMTIYYLRTQAPWLYNLYRNIKKAVK